jgi:hypothetical protein
MSLHSDLLELKNKGVKQAQELSDKLSPSLVPVNLFKAICTIKSAELLTRLRHSDGNDLGKFLGAVGIFVDSSLTIAGGSDSGDEEGGRVAIQTLEELFPISEEDFRDPSRFAIRQHTLDALLVFTAQSMGKETETQEAIQTLQMEFMRIVVGGMIHDTIGEKPIGNAGNA